MFYYHIAFSMALFISLFVGKLDEKLCSYLSCSMYWDMPKSEVGNKNNNVFVISLEVGNTLNTIVCLLSVGYCACSGYNSLAHNRHL